MDWVQLSIHHLPLLVFFFSMDSSHPPFFLFSTLFLYNYFKLSKQFLTRILLTLIWIWLRTIQGIFLSNHREICPIVLEIFSFPYTHTSSLHGNQALSKSSNLVTDPMPEVSLFTTEPGKLPLPQLASRKSKSNIYYRTIKVKFEKYFFGCYTVISLSSNMSEVQLRQTEKMKMTTKRW